MKPHTLSYSTNSVGRSTVFDGFTIYGPEINENEGSLLKENDGATIDARGSATFRNLIIYGPRKNGKIYTIFVGGKNSAPLFTQFLIYGGEGLNNGGFAKVEIIGTWRATAEFQDGQIFPGKYATNSHRTLVEGGNAHTAFTRVTFHPASKIENPSASQFIVAAYLNNANYTHLYSEFRECIIFGANAGNTVSDIFKVGTSNNTVDFAQYVVSGNHVILGSSPGANPNRFANVDLEPTITQAGGVFENNHFWNSVDEYQAANP